MGKCTINYVCRTNCQLFLNVIMATCEVMAEGLQKDKNLPVRPAGGLVIGTTFYKKIDHGVWS